jgi:hypothetical protein
VEQRGMEEAPENGKELSHSAYANGMNEYISICTQADGTLILLDNQNDVAENQNLKYTSATKMHDIYLKDVCKSSKNTYTNITINY